MKICSPAELVPADGQVEIDAKVRRTTLWVAFPKAYENDLDRGWLLQRHTQGRC